MYYVDNNPVDPQSTSGVTAGVYVVLYLLSHCCSDFNTDIPGKLLMEMVAQLVEVQISFHLRVSSF